MSETRIVGFRAPEGLMDVVRTAMDAKPGESSTNVIRRALAKAAGVDPDDYPSRPVGRPIVHGRRSRKHPQAA